MLFRSLGYCHPAWVQAVCDQAATLQHTSNPVSYTHLDVYKRQTLSSTFCGSPGIYWATWRRRLSPARPQKVLDKVWQLADKRFAQGVPRKPGLKELLSTLEDLGMPRIVASSSPRNMIEMNLQTSGTARYFHDVVSGTEVARSKPAPDTFLLAAEKLHTDPKDCLVLEDSFNGCLLYTSRCV